MTWFTMLPTVRMPLLLPDGRTHRDRVAADGRAPLADYYGRRVATVSSDQMLRVFDLSEDGEWVPRWASKAHDASINRVRSRLPAPQQ